MYGIKHNKMECCPEKSIDNSSPVGGGSVDLTNVTTNNLTVLNQAQIANLTGTGTALLENLTVTGTTNLADLNLTNITCSTLEASTYVRAKNTSNDTVSMLMNSSTEPINPRRGVIRTASTAFGLELETLGSNKAIRSSSDMVTLSSLNTEGPAFVQVGSNTSSDRGKVKITANNDVEVVSLLSEVNLSAFTNFSLESITGILSAQALAGSVILSAPLGNVGIYSGLTTLPSLLPGVTVNSSTSLTLSSTLGTSITAGLLSSSVATPGDILIKATQTAGVGGSIALEALSTFPGISPPNAISLTTDVGVIALTSGAGGVAVTTGAGLASIATGGGAIQLRTGVDVSLGSGGILLETLIGGPIQIIAATDAISMAASLGGVNIGRDATSTVGQFTVFTSNNIGAATGNITMSTHGTGVLTGPGNIVIDGTQAFTGNMSLYSKGTLQITSNNTATGSVSNTTGGIYLNTSASSGVGQVYNWRFPSGPGTSGQVLSSNGASTAQSWVNVPTLSSGNISVNNVFFGYYELTASSYIMTVASPYYTTVTVSSGGAVQISLPDATTLPLGAEYIFNCNGITPVHIKTFTNSSIVNIGPGSVATVILTNNTTSTGVWDWHEQLPTGTKWATAALTTPSTITTENTTDASALNTGALISLGGASISKKLFVGNLINLGGAATANNSIVLENIATGTVNNALSIGTTGSPTVFKFFPFYGILEGPIFRLLGSTSGNINLQCPAVTTSYDLTFPSTAGSANQVLTTNGSGVCSWTTPTAQSSAFTTPITSTLTSGYTTSTNILSLLEPSAANSTLQGIVLGVAGSLYNQAEMKFSYVSAGNDNNSITFGLNGSGVFRMYPALGILEGPIFRFQGSTSGYIDLKVPATTSTYALTLPSTAGTSGQFLTTNGFGTTSWSTVSPNFTEPITTALSSSYTTSTTILSLLQPSAANATYQIVALGKSISSNSCALLEYNYVSASNTANYFGIGTVGNENAFRFYPGTNLFFTPLLEVTNSFSSAALLSVKATNGGAGDPILSSFLAPFITVGIPTSYFGANTAANYNYATQKFLYYNSGNTANYLEFQIAGGTVVSQVKSDSFTISGQSSSALLNVLAQNSAGSPTILSLLQPSAANATYQIVALGQSISSNDCALLEFSYVSSANTVNYLGIGTVGSENLFKFYSGLKTFSTPKLEVYGIAADTGNVVSVQGLSTNSSIMRIVSTDTGAATFLSCLAINSANLTTHSCYFGVDTTNFNSGFLRFKYDGLNNGNNGMSIGMVGGPSTVYFGNYTFQLGINYFKNQIFCNWDQLVPNGDSAITISPSVADGDASIRFRTNLNNGGGVFKIGHNINGQGGSTLCFYSDGYGGNLGYMNTSAYLIMNGGVTTPNITTNADMEIQASNGTGKKILIHAGGYQTGGVYINSWAATSSYVPSWGSTNIGNVNLGNSLFVGVQQENYIGSLSANGIVNICQSLSNNQFMTFYQLDSLTRTPNNAIGSITSNIGGGVTYNTTSDYRIKQNIVDMPSIIPIINQLRPVQFNFLNCEQISHGFLAHEVQECYPEAVSGEKDAVDQYGKPLLQQLSLSNFTPILTKAVQELHELILNQQETILNLTARLLVLEQK